MIYHKNNQERPEKDKYTLLPERVNSSSFKHSQQGKSYDTIVGSAVLYDVKLYQSKEEFIADQSKHFATAAYSDRKYGFSLSDAKRFHKPIPMKGQLAFLMQISDASVVNLLSAHAMLRQFLKPLPTNGYYQ